MMRSPELQYCLDSPYLRYDESTAALVAKDLEKAEKFLKEAPGKKDALEQMNTAYQSMYCAAHALLHSIKYRATGFRAMLTVLEDYFVKKQFLDRIHVDHLLRSQKLEGTPQETFDAAAAMIAAVKKAVGQ